MRPQAFSICFCTDREAAYRSWDSEEHFGAKDAGAARPSLAPGRRCLLGRLTPIVLRIHRYICRRESLHPKPYAIFFGMYKLSWVRDSNGSAFLSGLNQFQIMAWRQKQPVLP